MVNENGRRDLEKQRFWRDTLQRQSRSGLSIREFCDQEQLKVWTFSWWRRELAKRDREQPASKPKDASSFVPVQLVPDTADLRSSSTIEIVLPAGQTVRVPAGFDSDALAGVLEVLETRSC